MNALPDMFTFEQIETKGLFEKAKAIPNRQRKGVWSEIMLLGALNEIWERVFINGETLKQIGLVEIRDKYNVGSFTLSDLNFLTERTEPPTIADAKRIRQARRDQQNNRCRTHKAIPDVEFEAISQCNEDEWMIKNLTNARDWLNDHGYVCEVKLTKLIL